MQAFCTLFDSAYLARGLAMYESLVKHEPQAQVFIFAFDAISYQILQELKLKQATIISLGQLETSELLAVKPHRSRAEYCWTCKPDAISYVFEHYHVNSCTYVDADLYFFASPAIFLKELEGSSVLLTSHRFSPAYQSAIRNGKFCAQWLSFKNNYQGRDILNWWRQACIQWCYNRHEKDCFGDQKYLETMIEQFSGVLEINHLGSIGPWNMQQYKFYYENTRLKAVELCSEKPFEVVFFHFHHLQFLQNKKFNLGNYKVPPSALDCIYKPYINEILAIKKRLVSYDGVPQYDKKQPWNWKSPLRTIKRKLNGVYNIVHLDQIKNKL